MTAIKRPLGKTRSNGGRLVRALCPCQHGMMPCSQPEKP